MLQLYFGDFAGVVTTVLILGETALIIAALRKPGTIKKWGRLILLFVVIGTAISAFSAMRDAYMMENAVFAANSVQSIVCSAAGVFIALAGVAALIGRNQKFRRIIFYMISAAFVLQVLTVEVTRIALYAGGSL